MSHTQTSRIVFSLSSFIFSFDRSTKKPFIIGCKKIVLANGTSDLANRLGVRGEKTMSWLKYELPSLENAIECMKVDEKINSKPVLIVGAGLSAADAVIACRNSGIKVIHVFRSLTGGFVSFLHAKCKVMIDCIC